MKYLYISLAALVFSATACKDQTETPSATTDQRVQTEELPLVLNDGEKWQMDDHTRMMVKTMTERVEGEGDPETIGKGLQKDLDELIEGCTMTGPAHDQLHAFLTVFIPAVQGTTANPSEESLKKVEGMLHEYPNYFE